MLKLSIAGMELSCKANADVGDWGKTRKRVRKQAVHVCACNGESHKAKGKNKIRERMGRGAGKSKHGNKKWQIL